MIIITGSIVARPETVDEVVRLSLEHVHRSREEPGCISHAVHRDVENPLRLVFFEEWKDRPAIEQHFTVPASREFVRLVRGLAAEMAPISIFEATPLAL